MTLTKKGQLWTIKHKWKSQNTLHIKYEYSDPGLFFHDVSQLQISEETETNPRLF